MFHSILVAIDGSDHAERALAEAIELAQSEHARLTVFSAVVSPPAGAYLGGGSGVAAQIARAAELDAEALLRRAAARVPADVSVCTVLTKDPVRAALIGQIERGSHDLVVM